MAWLFNSLLAILLTFFLKFHLYLVLGNKTTIDNLDRSSQLDVRPYDKGPVHNFQQVFGAHPALWPFPIMGQAGKPANADGVNWK